MISNELQGAIDRAFECAAAEGRANVEVEHVLLSLLELPSVIEWLKSDAREIEALGAKLRSALRETPAVVDAAESGVVPSTNFAAIMQRAILEAQRKHHLEVRPSDVAYLILSNNASIARWANVS